MTTAQFQLLKDAPHELALLAGVIVNLGNTGAAGVGATPGSTITPTAYLGKGLGDLPDSAGFLRAFAATGQVGYEIPTTSFDLVSGNPVPQNLVWGTSLQFSMPYLKSNVVDLGLPDFINHLIPIVEAQLTAPVAKQSRQSIRHHRHGQSRSDLGRKLFPGRGRSDRPDQSLQRHQHRRNSAAAFLSRRHIPQSTLGQPLLRASAPMKSMAGR